MRALEPDQCGVIDRDGVAIAYESFGNGQETVLLLPTWAVVPARFWKAQVPCLARSMRVVIFDPRGNGGSGRPADPSAYGDRVGAADALAVLDHLGVPSAAVVGLSDGVKAALLLAAEHAERVTRVVFMSGSFALGSAGRGGEYDADWEATPDPVVDDWRLMSRRGIELEFDRFIAWFETVVAHEPHSSKLREDGCAWARGTDGPTIVHTMLAPTLDEGETRRLLGSVRCPVLVVHGTDDRVIPHAVGVETARLAEGRLVSIDGAGHAVTGRHPVRTNLVLREFLARPQPSEGCARPAAHTPRALVVSSPIGLGHAHRDLAIAAELRRLCPRLEIDWLAQEPVTALLERCGETIHPASAYLASESDHWVDEACGHRLHAFQAFRRLDEILVANFHVFHDAATEGRYDLWIGDEAWDVDYHLHENPGLKSAPYAWLTDFVGFQPLPTGGAEEAALTADYNAEMVEQVERSPWIRDVALFIGDAEDLHPGTFGPGLPEIRAWTAERYVNTGYVLPDGLPTPEQREPTRARLGWAPPDRVLVAAVGGSGIGAALLQRVIEASPALHAAVPGLRVILATGPRVALPAAVNGVEVLAFTADLPAVLAAADAAIVQGGLATGMELAAAGVPFMFVPLDDHYEQQLLVRPRLERYGGRAMAYADCTPARLAGVVAELIGAPIAPRHIDRGGAGRAAAAIAPLLDA